MSARGPASVARVARPAVLSRIPLDRHGVIEASAGTGKTYTLEHMVVDRLLRTDTTLEQMLVVTFTEKATAELRARVRAKLVELRDATRVDDADDAWTIDDAARARLSAALASFDRAQISTIHGFCRRVLAEGAFEGGRLFEQTQVDGRDALEATLRDLVRTRFAREPGDRALIAAWLGAGESMQSLATLLVAAARVRGELRPHVSPEAIAAAVAALGDALARAGALDAEMKAAKLHASTQKSVRERVARLARFVADTRDGDVLARVVAFAEVRESTSTIVEKLGPLDGPVVRALVAAAERADDALPSLEGLVVATFLPAVREQLDRVKRERGQLDFDDMILALRDALTGPNGDALVRTLAARFRVALVDEFQDTDEAQWAIFRRIFLDGGGLLYAIGDPKQAIYGFRGADVHTYLHACDALVAAGGARVSLTTSFRSTAGVIAAYDRIFDPGPRSAFFDGAVRYLEGVACGRPDRDLVDADGATAPPLVLLRVGGDAGVAKLGAAAARDQLERAIAREIRAICDPASGLRVRSESGERPIAPRDVFVLTRNDREARDVGEALGRAGVPHAFYKREGLFQTRQAEDVLALLVALAAPHDRSARLRALLGPFFGAPLERLAALSDAGPEEPLVARLLAWSELAEARRWDLLFARVLAESRVVRRELVLGAGERAIADLTHVIELVSQEIGRARLGPREIAERVAAWVEERESPPGASSNVQRIESDREAVQIMTMHKSKGLEAEVVFVAGGLTKPPKRDAVVTFTDGGARVAHVAPCPARFAARVTAERREEDQRLLYVTLTRARSRLYVPWFATGDASAARFAPTGTLTQLDARLDRIVTEGGLAVRDALELAREPARDADALEKLELPDLSFARPRDEGDAAKLHARAGLGVTSYTRLARVSPRVASPSARDEAAPPRAPAEGALPGGARIGTFLHELIEQLDLAAVRAHADATSFVASGAARATSRACARRHGLAESLLPEAERLAWSALATPIALPGGGTLDGFARAERLLRETEFVYPFPEPTHPPMATRATIPPGGLALSRGYVRGFIDAIVVHEGRTWIVDWKSDALDAFDPKAVDEHVRGHYADQILLYSLAGARMLGASDAATAPRLAGVLYVFLRGLPAPAAIWSRAVSWDDLLGWERELSLRVDVGLAPLEDR